MKNIILTLNEWLQRMGLCLCIPFLLGATVPQTTTVIKLNDPTLPPNLPTTTSSPNLGNYQLNAIYIYPNEKFAIINNKIVKIGNQLDHFTITKITRYTVELSGTDHQKEYLHIAPPVKSNE